MQSLRLDPRRGAPPDSCPSCGRRRIASGRWIRAEVGLTAGELVGYGIVGQGYDIDVDDTRRIRLLAFVDASFYAAVHRSGPGKRYPIFTGDPQWFSDNIPCMTACPSHTDISRYIALHRRRPLRRLASSSTASTTSSPAAWAACAPAPARMPAAARKSTPRSASATSSASPPITAAKPGAKSPPPLERPDRRHHRRRRRRPDRRPPTRPQGLQGHHLRDATRFRAA